MEITLSSSSEYSGLRGRLLLTLLSDPVTLRTRGWPPTLDGGGGTLTGFGGISLRSEPAAALRSPDAAPTIEGELELPGNGTEVGGGAPGLYLESDPTASLLCSSGVEDATGTNGGA